MVVVNENDLIEGQTYRLHDYLNEFHGKVKIIEVNVFYRYIICQCLKTKEQFHFSGHGLFYES